MDYSHLEKVLNCEKNCTHVRKSYTKELCILTKKITNSSLTGIHRGYGH